MIIVATVVEEMFQVTNDPEFLTELNDYIKERYVCTDNGPVKWFLGIHFQRRDDGSFHLSQTALIEKMLTKFWNRWEGGIQNTS